jgi:hypothetical protein
MNVVLLKNANKHRQSHPAIKYLKQNSGQTTREIKAPFTAPAADDKK